MTTRKLSLIYHPDVVCIRIIILSRQMSMAQFSMQAFLKKTVII